MAKKKILKNKYPFEIIDEVAIFMRADQKINDRIIYFCDVKLNIFKEVIRKQGKYKIKVKSERSVILKDELWTINASKQSDEFFMKQIKNKVHLTKLEKFEIKKIITKAELGCSFNKN